MSCSCHACHCSLLHRALIVHVLIGCGSIVWFATYFTYVTHQVTAAQPGIGAWPFIGAGPWLLSLLCAALSAGWPRLLCAATVLILPMVFAQFMVLAPVVQTYMACNPTVTGACFVPSPSQSAAFGAFVGACVWNVVLLVLLIPVSYARRNQLLNKLDETRQLAVQGAV